MTTPTIAAARTAVERLAREGDFMSGDTFAGTLATPQHEMRATVRIDHANGNTLMLEATGADREGAIRALSDLIARAQETTP